MSKPNIEATKEILRWVVFFIVSWFISETMKQLNLIPEYYKLKIYVFTYLIPIRSIFAFFLTMIGRYADKYLHEKNKEKGYISEAKPMGILPF